MAFYQLCIKDSSSWINKTYRNLTIIAIISYTLTIVGDCLRFIIFFDKLITKYPVRNKTEEITIVVLDVIYYFGNCIFYSLILLRIHKPFKLSKCIYYSVVLFICVAAVSAIVFCVEMFLPDRGKNRIYTGAVLSIADFMLNWCLLIVFAYKMMKTVKGIDVALSADIEKNVNLITNVITKHCVLFGIATFMNQGYVITIIMFYKYHIPLVVIHIVWA
eukprot:98627_1